MFYFDNTDNIDGFPRNCSVNCFYLTNSDEADCLRLVAYEAIAICNDNASLRCSVTAVRDKEMSSW